LAGSTKKQLDGLTILKGMQWKQKSSAASLSRQMFVCRRSGCQFLKGDRRVV
jgi:hypothetical protein